jgi:hypothetical protein
MRVPTAFRGLPLFAVPLLERAWMAAPTRSRWSISSVRIASVWFMEKLYKNMKRLGLSRYFRLLDSSTDCSVGQAGTYVLKLKFEPTGA